MSLASKTLGFGRRFATSALRRDGGVPPIGDVRDIFNFGSLQKRSFILISSISEFAISNREPLAFDRVDGPVFRIRIRGSIFGRQASTR